jgi:acetylornithine/N-succinyldiaminopimelate aminotransferase
MNTNQKVTLRDQSSYLPTFKRFPIAFKRGKGAWLWDVEGKKYLDLLAGIAVNSIGHCHPELEKAISKQTGILMHVSNFFVSEPQVNLAEMLTKISGLPRVFFTNSGAESVEGAIKVARKYAHSKGKGGTIISMQNSFHGRTLATIATGQEKYKKGFEPIPTGFFQIPFNDFDAFRSKITTDIAAVIVELIQGEGGIKPADTEFVKQLRKICEEHDILLIFDEIQTGIGRTGKWFAKDHYGIQPDIMTLAKGLGGGMPIGALLCNDKVSKAIEFGDHGTTFGGNPLACAAALAVIEVIENENLCGNASQIGEFLSKSLKELASKHSQIKEIRGKGLMIGVEMNKPAAPLVKMLLDKGVVANATAENVLRLLPPLIINQTELEFGIKKIDDCLKQF